MPSKAERTPEVHPGSPMVSVLAVVENDVHIITDFLHDVVSVLSERYPFYEVVLIDNSSTDGSHEALLTELEHTPHLHLVRLSSVRDLEVATTAALDACIGDYAVLIDPRVDPPDQIPRMVELAMSGYDVVIAHRQDAPRAGLLRRTFYRVASAMLDQELHPDASYFRVLGRPVVTALTKIKNRRRYLKYFNALVGYRQTTIQTRAIPRGARLREEPLTRSLQKAIDLVISNSAAPLRLATLLGLLGSGGSLAYLGYTFAVAIVKQHLAEGWLTISVVMSSLFFCMFLILSVLSEYVARILEEAQERPLYFVELERTSSATTNRNEFINVV
jgi:glycosyltransferase involved in cell wall biosynthesis